MHTETSPAYCSNANAISDTGHRSASSNSHVIRDAPGQLRLFDENNKEWRYEFLTRRLTPPP